MKHKLTAALLTATLTVACAGMLLTACGGKDLSKAEIELSQTEYVYDGTARMPDVTVTYGKQQIESSQLYIEYSNNVNAGTATVTVTPATSDYKGVKTAEFTILKADTSVDQEVYLTAQYNQTIGEVIGDYNIAESDKGYTEATVLTEIGEKTYSFRSLYTPADSNYNSAYQTVYITVNKADPDGAGELARSYDAFVGDKYSSLQLPNGVEAVEPDSVFQNTGTAQIGVVIKQTVNGTVDEEHYNVIEKTVTVNVQPKEFEFGENAYVYHNAAFHEDDMTVNGNAMIESTYESFENWTVSISFTGTVESFDLHMMFDNVVDSKVTDWNKQNLFEFGEDADTLTSWLGGLVSNLEGTTSDTVSLPEYGEWEGYKITVVSVMDPTTITRREYKIYFGDSAEEGLGTLMFTRSTDRKHQYRFQFIFQGAQNVEITDMSFSESAYVHNKLLNEKFTPYLNAGTTTVKDEYKNGGLLMIGDSLVDYWGMDFDNKTASAPASTASFGQYGYTDPVINLGIGSASAEDWLNYFEAAKEYFEQLNPTAVYMLIGCNQISFEDEKNISDTVIKLIEKVSAMYPNAAVIVNSMMPTITTHSRWANWYRLEGANKRIAQYIDSSANDKLIYFDTQTMFTPNPEKPVSSANAPLASWHANDGLHYKQTAYDVWAEKLLECMGANGLVEYTNLAVTLRHADSDADMADYVAVKYSMCNRRLYLTVELDTNRFAVTSILLNGEEIISYYNVKAGTLEYTAQSYFATGTLEIVISAGDSLDDNVSDDDGFVTRFNGNLADAEITLSQTRFVYNGTAFEPEVTVKLNGAVVDSATYAVAYINNVTPGMATVRVYTIDDNGYAERTLTFEITITLEVRITDKNGEGDYSQYADVTYEVRDGRIYVSVAAKPLPGNDETKVASVTVNGTDATEYYDEATCTFEYDAAGCGSSAEVVIALDYEADPNDNVVDDNDLQNNP